MALDSRDALLARLWTLASFPLQMVGHHEYEEEIRTFIEACVRPEDGIINTDVARSIIPQKYNEEVEIVPDLIEEEIKEYQADDNLMADDEPQPKSPSMSSTMIPQNMYILPSKVPTPTQNIPLTEMYYRIQAQPISKLLALNHKAASTDAYKESILEGKLLVTFSRIEDLKRRGRWSTKQRQRFSPPARLPSHWDNVLSEAQAVRAGKTGERRQKISICHKISEAVLQYFEDKERAKQSEALEQLHLMNCGPIVPLHSLHRLSQDLIENLHEVPTFGLTYSEAITNSLGLVPISKFIPPVEYDDSWKRILVENIENQSTELIGDSNVEKQVLLEGDVSRDLLDEDTEENDKIRVKFRVKSDHEIRPPQPPPLRYLASRVGSAWHAEDDEELFALTNQYHNNWQLIANSLQSASKNMFTSNVVRRTPWQAFERWVQLTQPDPKDFKGRYAEASRQWLEAASKTSQAARKRQMPVTLAPDAYLRGHQKLRWASVLEGIRKVKRKRETVAKPPTPSFANRQRPDVPQHKTYSAQELSQVKIDSDKKAAAQAAQSRLVSRARPDQNMRASVNSGVVSGQRIGNMNRPTPNADISGGSMPSIAGLPLPPSVAAAARIQQMKAQQAQQIQAQQAAQQATHGQQGPIPNSQQQPIHRMNQQQPAGAPHQPSLQQGQQLPGVQNRFMQQTQRAQQAQLQQIRAQQMQQAGKDLPNSSMQTRPAGLGGRSLTPQQQQQLRNQQILQAQRLQQAQTQAQARSPSGAPNAVNRPRMPFSREQLQNLMTQIAQSNPALSQQEVQQLALQHMRRYIQMRNAQAARATQNGTNNGPNTNSRQGPHHSSPVAASPPIQSPNMQSSTIRSPSVPNQTRQNSAASSPASASSAVQSPAIGSRALHSPASQSPAPQ